MNYSKVFIKTREALGLSRPELSSKIGITAASLWKIENGKSTPKQKTVRALAELSHVSVAQLNIFALEQSDFVVL